MVELLLSYLVAAAGKSKVIRVLSKFSRSSKELSSKSFTVKIVRNTLRFLLTGSKNSLFMKILKSSINLLAPVINIWGRARKIRLITKIEAFLSESYFIDNFLSPIAFLLMALLFFTIANVLYGIRTLILIFSGLLSFLIGTLWGNIESKKLKPEVKESTILFFGLIMIIMGFVGFFLQIRRVMAIPILNEAVRRRLSPKYNYMAWTSVPGTLYILSVFKKSTKREGDFPITLLLLIGVGFIPTFLLGYRTEMLAYFIGILTVLYYRNYVSRLVLLLSTIFGAFLYMITSIVRLMFAGLTANPFWAAAYRPTITAGFLEGIVMRYGWSEVTGGLIHLSAISSLLRFVHGPRYGPRTLIGIYAGGRRGISTTATIFAQFLLDFGIKGVILAMLFLGLLLSLAFNMARKKEALLGPYATLLSYSLVGIETGILDLNIYIYFALSALVVLLSLRYQT